MDFHDQAALVTGAASGIGRACALRLAQSGARVAVSDVNESGGEETAALIRQGGGSAVFIRADVARAEDTRALVEQTLQVFGRLDAAVNNAGVGGAYLPTHEQDEADWDRVLSINLKGVWLCLKYELPPMLAQGGGAIVNVASLAGLLGFRYGAAYAASKHGVVGLTRSAALDYADRGIRVNAVCPTFTDTPMVDAMEQASPALVAAIKRGNPMRRLGTAEEVAAAVVWLCSAEAAFITGHALTVDGGQAVQ